MKYRELGSRKRKSMNDDSPKKGRELKGVEEINKKSKIDSDKESKKDEDKESKTDDKIDNESNIADVTESKLNEDKETMIDNDELSKIDDKKKNKIIADVLNDSFLSSLSIEVDGIAAINLIRLKMTERVKYPQIQLNSLKPLILINLLMKRIAKLKLINITE